MIEGGCTDREGAHVVGRVADKQLLSRLFEFFAQLIDFIFESHNVGLFFMENLLEKVGLAIDLRVHDVGIFF